MNRKIRILAAAAAFAATGALAQGKACTPADQAATEKALDRVVSWDHLYKTFKDYGHCDNVMTEDNFTDALMRLAVEWKNVEQFANRYQSDAGFKAFVNTHMKGLSAKDDVKSLYSRAKQSCPAKLDAFCAELAEVAKAAM
jgi:hypothetical protein